MEDVGATVFYDDEDDCLDYDCMQNIEYDFDYVDAEKENLYELYEYCLSPTLYDTGRYMLPLLGSTVLFRLFVYTRKILSSIYMICIIFSSIDYFICVMMKRTLLFNISAYISHRIFHILSVIIGLYVIQYYMQECLIILIVLVLFSYGILYIPKKWHGGIGIFLPSLLIIAYWYVFIVSWNILCLFE